jgi:hypothetical protein
MVIRASSSIGAGRFVPATFAVRDDFFLLTLLQLPAEDRR